MDSEYNKKVVAQFCESFGRADFNAILDMMADDATWWVLGKQHLFPDAGIRSKAEMAKAWPALYAKLEGGLNLEVLGMIAEGSRVAAEVRSDARTKAGKRYENDYHFIFELKAGKISAVREYTDLMHAAETFE